MNILNRPRLDPESIVFEGQQVRWSDGPRGQTVTLLLNPADTGEVNPFKSYPSGTEHGQRWQVVCVPIGDDESTPSPPETPSEVKERKPFHTLPRSQQAGILCADWRFGEWLSKRFKTPVKDDAAAAAVVRSYCEIKSRADLDSNTYAADGWDRLVTQYQIDTGQLAEPR